MYLLVVVSILSACNGGGGGGGGDSTSSSGETGQALTVTKVTYDKSDMTDNIAVCREYNTEKLDATDCAAIGGTIANIPTSNSDVSSCNISSSTTGFQCNSNNGNYTDDLSCTISGIKFVNDADGVTAATLNSNEQANCLAYGGTVNSICTGLANQGDCEGAGSVWTTTNVVVLAHTLCTANMPTNETDCLTANGVWGTIKSMAYKGQTVDSSGAIKFSLDSSGFSGNFGDIPRAGNTLFSSTRVTVSFSDNAGQNSLYYSNGKTDVSNSSITDGEDGVVFFTSSIPDVTVKAGLNIYLDLDYK